MGTEIDELRAALDMARETNKKLHRRVQKMESRALPRAIRKRLSYLEHVEKTASNHWLGEFNRVLGAHTELSRIYKICAPILGLKHEAMHSVMDWRFCSEPNPERHVFANAYIDRKLGGIETHRVVDVVQALADRVDKA